MDRLDHAQHVAWRQVGVERNDGIEEVVPLETERGTPVHRRQPDLPEQPLQLADRQPQILIRTYVAADPEVDRCHFSGRQSGTLSRRIRTPTSRAPRIAPGLLTRTCTEGTGNSSRISAAIFSARVSTSWKLDSPTNCCTRFAIAL